LNALRALNACSLDGTHMMEQLDLGYGGSKNVVTLGMRCCDLLWVDSARGSRRALRTRSPRILCRCPVLRRQILSVFRRDMGAESRGHRGRNRSCPALPQGRACPNRACRSLDGAVARLTLLIRTHPDVRCGGVVPRVSARQIELIRSISTVSKRLNSRR
jgi:hypothetical protein